MNRRLLGSFSSPYVCIVVIMGMLTLGSSCGGGNDATGATGGGGGGGGGTGGGGGSGGGNIPTISYVAPSQAITTVAPSMIPIIHGTNFTPSSKIEINGNAVNTTYQSSIELWGFPSPSQLASPGAYSVEVTSPAGKSNAVSLTIYEPNRGPQPFIALPGYYTGPQFKPTPIAVADFNNDGFADVVAGITDQGDTDIALLLGQSDGSLGAPQFLLGGAWSLTAGDIDGDGFADVVAGNFPAVGTTNNQTTSSITVLLNDGAGNFTASTPQVFTGTFPGPMLLADILGTARNDLIVASHDPDLLYLFPNQGDGTFGQPITIASLGPDRWFTVADFDGDGRLDIAYSGLNSVGKENTHLLLNQSGGTFNDVVPTSFSSVGGIVISGDFNNDGRSDLAVETNIGTASAILLEIFLNQGNNVYSKTSTITLGPAQSVPYQFVVGDFDHDGLLDVAGENASGVPASMLMLWGNGAGDFTQQQVVGPSAFELASGDINGDGIPDLIVPDELLGLTVVLGQHGRTYPQPTSIYPEVTDCMSVGDVNGDGAPDLFFCGDSLNLTPGSVFLNDGHGNFSPAGRPSYEGGQIADLTGSGKADMVTFLGSTIMIWPGTGDPNYPSAPITISVPENIGRVGSQIVDLDGDGKPDIVGDNAIGWNLGNYQFDFAPINMNGVFAVGDVNNDGQPDLIAANGTFLNLGSRQFRQILNNGLPITFGDVAALGDFNGDGKLDAAFAATLTDDTTVVVAYGNGDGTFYVQGEVAATGVGTGVGSIVSIAVGDFNGDGLADIVTAIEFGTQMVLYTNDGNGEFETSMFATGAGPTAIAEADFNLDGKPDIVILDPIPIPPSNAVVVFSH